MMEKLRNRSFGLVFLMIVFGVFGLSVYNETSGNHNSIKKFNLPENANGIEAVTLTIEAVADYI